MKKFLLADDHQVVRNGLRLILCDEFSEVEIDEAQNAQEVFTRMKEKKYDIVILDINMPGRNGLDVLHQLKEEGNKIPVLVLSGHSEEQIAIRVIKLGAYGYLSKEAPDTELVNAVNQILTGKKYITPSLAELLAEQLENPQNKPLHELLSEREYQTMILIASGKTTADIAKEL